MSFYRKTVLPGGLRVVTETIPTVRSVSLGVWVGAGSCWETDANQGISHLIEHMLFKGTAHRTARLLAQEIDGRGGSLNAFTSKEHTCYYARVLDDHLPVAVDVLSDMIGHSTLDPAELTKEKGVIAEEIRMYEDVPDEIVHDLFAAASWPGHPLGRPVLGTAQAVLDLPRTAILQYISDHYTTGNMVVAAAGNVEHERTVQLMEQAFAAPDGHRAAGWPEGPITPARPRAAVRVRDTEQVHLVLGCPGLPLEHPDIYALHIINTIIGGGATSHLFQEIREDRGLAYSVYSYTSSFRNSGMFAVYAGTSPATWREVLGLLAAELDCAGAAGLPADEVIQAREQLKGQLMLSMESTSGRMTRLGRGELAYGEVLSPDEILARIDAVTPEQVAAVCARLFTEPGRVLAAVGPLAGGDLSPFGFAEVTHA